MMKKIILTISILSILIPSVSFGAIAYDTLNDGGWDATGDNYTHSITVPSDNPILWESIYSETDDVLTVTASTTAMTLVSKIIMAAPQTNQASYLYVLVAPPAGNTTITIDKSSNDGTYGVAATYTGAKQTQVMDTDIKRATTTNAGASISGTVTTTVDNSWVVAGMRNSSGSGSTPDAGTTERLDSAPNGAGWFDSGAAVTPAGTKTLGASYSSSANIVTFHVASFSPYVAPSAAPPTILRRVQGQKARQ